MLEAPLSNGDFREIRSIQVGSIGDKRIEPPVRCLECGAICTELHAEVFLGHGWRCFCVDHAKALAIRQLRAANRKLRALKRHGADLLE